jgi:Fic family protein
MQLAIDNATVEVSVGVEQIVDIHRTLLEQASNSHIAGKIRTEQNWIGGNDYNPCGAAFVPPPPEEVDWLLSDLCRFCNDDRLPPLVQAAIAHAQFETIHPFHDGNGRTGRALVQVILRRRGLAPNYVPPISVILATNRDRYINGLTAYRMGHIEAWLEVFNVSAARAARLAGSYLSEVATLQEKWRQMVRRSTSIRADAAAWRIIDVLPAQPIITLPAAVATVGRTKPAVNQAIGQLVAAGVLTPLSNGKRNRSWEAVDLLDVLIRLESGDVPEGEPDLGPIPDVSEITTDVINELGWHIGSVGDLQITPLPFADAIYRLGPGSWLIPPGEQAEITFRLAVAMPTALPYGGGGSTQLVTRLRGQRREEFLIDLLETSPVTKWLRSLQSIWHWDEEVVWVPAGVGSPEFTELWFAPFGLDSRQPAFMARCGFATGVVDDDNVTATPSIQAAVDIMVNIRQLGVDRRPIGDGDASVQTPAPGALSLAEVADTLGHLFGFVAIAASAAESLLPQPQPETARVATWISVTGGIAEQAIDLKRFRRIPRSTGLSQAAGAFQFDLSAGVNLQESQIRELVADILYEGLERGGYRDIDEAIEKLKLES